MNTKTDTFLAPSAVAVGDEILTNYGWLKITNVRLSEASGNFLCSTDKGVFPVWPSDKINAALRKGK